MTSGSSTHRPRFAVIRAQQEGHDVLIVADLALDADRLMARYPGLVSVSLPMRNPDAKGLCDDVESERLADLEDALLDGLGSHDHCYTGRVTGHGVRAILLYVPESSGLVEALSTRAVALSSRAERIDVEHRADPHWSEFRSMSGGAGRSVPQ